MSEKKHYIITGGIVTDGVSTFIENGALEIDGGKIAKIGSSEELKNLDAEYIDVGGRIIMPAFLNPHHHLYSSLTTGLSPIGRIDGFVDILENLWWRLDKILDEESVYISALVGIIDSVEHGATTIFDHHASMNFVRGGLDTIAKAFELAKIEGLLCFETSDRMGSNEVEKHIAENLEFYEKHRYSKNIKGAFGLHANFTLSEKTLAKIAESKPTDMPIHIHCGEDFFDFDYCRNLGYSGPVDRLNKFGLLDNSSLLAHCVNLSQRDYELIDKIEPIVITNPESNANNRVGKMNRDKIGKYILGTDGMSGDILSTLRSMYLLGDGIDSDFDELSRTFFANRYAVQRKFFPNTGEFRVGASANIAVLDYIPMTPINHDNLLGHLIFGAKTGKAFLTISNGNILYRDGEIKFIDENDVIVQAKILAKKLFDKFYSK
ncbi:amidohydrolase family protein [bacterium]|nr:amidohydrolase family protein [bacterium]